MCDESDYERVIRPIERQMIRSIWRILRHAAEAFQDALQRIWKERRIVCKHPDSKTLVLRICTQSAFDLLRKRTRYKHETHLTKQLAEVTDAVLTPDDQLSQQEQHQKVLDDISSLPRNQAIALLMRLVDQLSYDDIASALGSTHATARTHVKRGRQRVRAQLLQRNDQDQQVEL